MQQLLAKAQAHERAREYEACYHVASQGLGLDPGNHEFMELQAEAEKILEKNRKVKEFLEKALQQNQAQEYNSALKTVEELLALEPELAEALELRRQATEALERRRRVEQLLAKARAHERAREYEACYQLNTEALRLDPEYPGLKELQEQSRQVLENTRMATKFLDEARGQLREGNFGKTLKLLESLLSLEPGHRQALDMKSLASDGLWRQQQVEDLLARARSYSQAGNYEGCYQVTSEALELQPEHAELEYQVGQHEPRPQHRQRSGG